jgi:mannan endo-1,4-beta-mannosidase
VALAAPNVKSVKSTATGVKVTWNSVNNASAYQLYRKVGNKVTKVGGTVTKTSAVDSSPVGGKTASYYVVALAGNKAGFTDSKEGSAGNVTLPAASKKVTATQDKGKTSVTVKWKKVKKATSYVIYRAESKNGKYKKVGTVKKGTSYCDKKVKKGKTYYYKVVTVSSKKYSPMKAAKKAVKVKG